MKLKLKFFNISFSVHLLFICILIMFNTNQIISLGSEFLESSTMETGLEAELFKLASKLHNKRISEKKEKEKNFMDVKVENSFDISDYLNFIEEIKNKNEEQKDSHKKSMENLKEKIENKLQNKKLNLKNLKNKKNKNIKK